VDGLEEQFGDYIDFFHLDVEQHITRDIRFEYTLTGRTQYVLIDAEGNIVQKWFGYLDEAQLAAFMTEYVASLEA